MIYVNKSSLCTHSYISSYKKKKHGYLYYTYNVYSYKQFILGKQEELFIKDSVKLFDFNTAERSLGMSGAAL